MLTGKGRDTLALGRGNVHEHDRPAHLPCLCNHIASKSSGTTLFAHMILSPLWDCCRLSGLGDLTHGCPCYLTEQISDTQSWYVPLPLALNC